MKEHGKINYVEYAAKNLRETKRFFEEAFNWAFVDYGPDYAAFSGQGLDGGFYKGDLRSMSDKGGALLIFYSDNLEATLADVRSAGGKIVRPIYEFPGGRRFHFLEPSGNEFAVWGEPLA